jgi:hypothetical protein
MATPTGYDAICFNVVVSVGTTGVIGGGVGAFFLLQEINPVIKNNMKKSTLFLMASLLYFEIHSFYQKVVITY